jgi:hypothetical protein
MMNYVLMGMLLFAGAVSACPVLSHDEQLEKGTQEKRAEQQAIHDLFAEADVVFTATVANTRQDDQQARIDVRFSDLAFIKGQNLSDTFYYDKDNAWHFEYSSAYMQSLPDEEIEQGVIRWGCEPRYDLITAFEPGFQYLVYVKAGRIIRNNQIIDWPEAYSGGEEVRFLKELFSTEGLSE